MKREMFILIALILTMMLLAPAMADAACQVCPLLEGVTGTGTGSALKTKRPYKDWGCKAKFTATADPTALEICLQGDPMGESDFADMLCINFSAAELTAGFAVKGAQTQVAAQIRGNLKTLTGGTDVVLDFGCTGGE